MRAIQLSGEVLSTGEAASAELCGAEAVHRTRSLRRLFKAAPTTPCVCREQQLETGLSNKHLKHTLEFYSTAVVRPSRGCSVPRCHTRWQLCGREPPGPDPHTTAQIHRVLSPTSYRNERLGRSHTVFGVRGQHQYMEVLRFARCHRYDNDTICVRTIERAPFSFHLDP